MNNKENVEAFIERWRGVTASELATAQTFVMNSCNLLDVEKPHAAADQECMFERPVDFRHGDGSASPGRIDCYKRGRWRDRLPKILETREALGRARHPVVTERW